jgi:hypothetical protein
LHDDIHVCVWILKKKNLDFYRLRSKTTSACRGGNLENEYHSY